MIKHTAYLIKDNVKKKRASTVLEGKYFHEKPFEMGVYRRPYHGLTLKDSARAYLMAIGYPNGTDKPPVDLLQEFMRNNPMATQAVNGKPFVYTDFVLSSVAHGQITRQQITQTFGDTYVDFFGEQPIYVKLSGHLLNSRDFPWKELFATLYDDVLQGPKLLQNKGHVIIGWDYTIIEGYPLQVTFLEQAENPMGAGFTMDFLVSEMTLMNTDMELADQITQQYYISQVREQGAETQIKWDAGAFSKLSDYLDVTGPMAFQPKTKSPNFWIAMLANLLGDAVPMLADCVSNARSADDFGNCLKGTSKMLGGHALNTMSHANLNTLFGVKGMFGKVNLVQLGKEIRGIATDHGDYRSIMFYSRRILKDVFGKWADPHYLGHHLRVVIAK